LDTIGEIVKSFNDSEPHHLMRWKYYDQEQKFLQVKFHAYRSDYVSWLPLRYIAQGLATEDDVSTSVLLHVRLSGHAIAVKVFFWGTFIVAVIAGIPRQYLPWSLAISLLIVVLAIIDGIQSCEDPNILALRVTEVMEGTLERLG